jgi:hypothetical protein
MKNTEQQNSTAPANCGNTMLCSVLSFRVFIRKTWTDIKITNDECDAILKDFSVYLRDKLTTEQLDRILPKNDIEVMMNMDNPIRMGGFHPAFMYHFTEFIQSNLANEPS